MYLENLDFIKDNDHSDALVGILHNYIDKNCLFRADPGRSYDKNFPRGKLPTRLTGNTEGMKYLFLLRRLSYNPVMTTYLSMLWMKKLIELFPNEESFQLGGIESSSIPLLIAFQKALETMFEIHVNVFTVMKERKDYGLFQFTNGIVYPDKPVLFIDDMVNSGSSFWHFRDVCEKELKVEVLPHLFSIMIMHANPPFYLERDDQFYQVHSIFNKADFDYDFKVELLTTMPGDVNV